MRKLSAFVALCGVLIAADAATITRNGRCGRNFGGTTCAGSIYGQCCAKSGWCGITQDHCLPANGCQSSFGTCTTPTANLNVSTNGKCGAAFGTTCQNSGFGNCCSQYNNCGSSAAYCGTGCQSQYGVCSSSTTPVSSRASFSSSALSRSLSRGSTSSILSSRSPSSSGTLLGNSPGSSTSSISSSRSTSSSNVLPTLPVSLNSRCGPSYGTRCPSGICCSKWGFCGATADHCRADACNPAFGICNPVSSLSSTFGSLPMSTWSTASSTISSTLSMRSTVSTNFDTSSVSSNVISQGSAVASSPSMASSLPPNSLSSTDSSISVSSGVTISSSPPVLVSSSAPSSTPSPASSSAGPIPSPQPANLVPNGGFESGGLDGWTQAVWSAKNVYAPGVFSGDSNSGIYAYRMFPDIAGKRDVDLYQRINLPLTQRKYVFSVAAKHSTNAGCRVKLYLNVEHIQLATHTPIDSPIATDWSTYSSEAYGPVDASGNVALTVRVSCESMLLQPPQGVFVDDIVMTEVIVDTAPSSSLVTTSSSAAVSSFASTPTVLATTSPASSTPSSLELTSMLASTSTSFSTTIEQISSSLTPELSLSPSYSASLSSGPSSKSSSLSSIEATFTSPPATSSVSSPSRSLSSSVNISPSPNPQTRPNLVPNGGFELGVMSPWEVASDNSVNSVSPISTGDAYTGNHSYHYVPDQLIVTTQNLTQYIPVRNVGSVFQFSMAAKRLGNDYCVVSAYLTASVYTTYTLLNAAEMKKQWKTFTSQEVVAWGPRCLLRVEITCAFDPRNPTNGFFVDDISLVMVYDPLETLTKPSLQSSTSETIASSWDSYSTMSTESQTPTQTVPSQLSSLTSELSTLTTEDPRSYSTESYPSLSSTAHLTSVESSPSSIIPTIVSTSPVPSAPEVGPSQLSSSQPPGASSSSIPPLASSLLLNGGFESGEIAPWIEATRGGKLLPSIFTGDSNSGRYAYRWFPQYSGYLSLTLRNAFVVPSESKEYTVSVAAKKSTGFGNCHIMGFLFSGGLDQVVINTLISKEWATYTSTGLGSFTASGASELTLRLSCDFFVPPDQGMPPNDGIFIDDVSVIPSAVVPVSISSVSQDPSSASMIYASPSLQIGSPSASETLEASKLGSSLSTAPSTSFPSLAIESSSSRSSSMTPESSSSSAFSTAPRTSSSTVTLTSSPLSDSQLSTISSSSSSSTLTSPVVSSGVISFLGTTIASSTQSYSSPPVLTPPPTTMSVSTTTIMTASPSSWALQFTSLFSPSSLVSTVSSLPGFVEPSPIASPEAKPILVNGGFESGIMTPWTLVPDPQGRTSLVSDGARTGKWLYRYEAQWQGSTVLAQVRQAITLVPGNEYSLSFAARLSPGSFCDIVTGLINAGDEQTLSRFGTYRPTTSWTSITQPIYPIKTTQVTIVIGHACGRVDNFQMQMIELDDISVVLTKNNAPSLLPSSATSIGQNVLSSSTPSALPPSVVSSSSATPEPSQIVAPVAPVANSDFESGALAPWTEAVTIGGSAKQSGSIATGDTSSGMYAYRFILSPGSSQTALARIQLSQTLNLQVDRSYAFSVAAKQVGMTSGACKLTVSIWPRSNTFTLSQAWATYSLAAPYVPTSQSPGLVMWVQCDTFAKANEGFLLDNILAVPIISSTNPSTSQSPSIQPTPTPTPDPVNLVSDGGFETGTLSSWFEIPYTFGTYRRSLTGDTKSGKYAYRTTSPDWALRQTISFPSQTKKYTLSVAARTSTTAGTCQVLVYMSDPAVPHELQENKVFMNEVLTNTWETYTSVVDFSRDYMWKGSKVMLVQVYCSGMVGSDEVFVDDISIF